MLATFLADEQLTLHWSIGCARAQIWPQPHSCFQSLGGFRGEKGGSGAGDAWQFRRVRAPGSFNVAVAAMKELSLVVGRVAEFLQPNGPEKRSHASVHLVGRLDLPHGTWRHRANLGAPRLCCACKFIPEAFSRQIETVCLRLCGVGELPPDRGGRP